MHALALIGIAAAVSLLWTASDRNERQATAMKSGPPILPEQRAPLLEALEIEGVRHIDQHQTLTTIRVPNPQFRHSRHFDRYCIVYEHDLYKSVHVICDAALNVSGGSSAAVTFGE